MAPVQNNEDPPRPSAGSPPSRTPANDGPQHRERCHRRQERLGHEHHHGPGLWGQSAPGTTPPSSPLPGRGGRRRPCSGAREAVRGWVSGGEAGDSNAEGPNPSRVAARACVALNRRTLWFQVNAVHEGDWIRPGSVLNNPEGVPVALGCRPGGEGCVWVLADKHISLGTAIFGPYHPRNRLSHLSAAQSKARPHKGVENAVRPKLNRKSVLNWALFLTQNLSLTPSLDHTSHLFWDHPQREEEKKTDWKIWFLNLSSRARGESETR